MFQYPAAPIPIPFSTYGLLFIMFMKHTLTYLLLTASVITALWAGGCKTVTEQEASVVPTPENNGAVCHITSVKGTFGTDSYTYNSLGAITSRVVYNASNNLTTSCAFVYNKNLDSLTGTLKLSSGASVFGTAQFKANMESGHIVNESFYMVLSKTGKDSLRNLAHYLRYDTIRNTYNPDGYLVHRVQFYKVKFLGAVINQDTVYSYTATYSKAGLLTTSTVNTYPTFSTDRSIKTITYEYGTEPNKTLYNFDLPKANGPYTLYGKATALLPSKITQTEDKGQTLISTPVYTRNRQGYPLTQVLSGSLIGRLDVTYMCP